MSLNSEFLGEIDSELLSGFLDESETYLTHLNDELMLLEESISESEDSGGIEVDVEILNAMFRDAHSLKGLSAMLGFGEINHLTHKIENVFDAARNSSLVVTRQVVEVILESVDLLSELIEGLSSDAASDSEACEAVAAKLAKLLDPEASSAPIAQEDKETHSEKQCAELQEVKDHTDIPEKYISFFLSEAEEAFTELHANLEAGADFELSNLLATLHRIKGSAATIGLNRLARVNHLLEDLVQKLNENDAHLDEQLVATIQFVVDRQNDFVASLKLEEQDDNSLVEAVRKMAELGASPECSADETQGESVKGHEELRDELEIFKAEFLNGEQASEAVLGVLALVPDASPVGLKLRLVEQRITEMGEVLLTRPEASAVNSEPVSYCFAVRTDKTIKDFTNALNEDGFENFVLSHCQAASPGAIRHLVEEAEATPPASESQAATETTPAAQVSPEGSSQKPSTKEAPKAKKSHPVEEADEAKKVDRPIETIRVDIERLDHLMNQAGQLAINKARFARIGDQFKELSVQKHTLHRFESATSLLEKMERDVGSGSRKARQGHLGSEALHTDLQRLRTEIESIQTELSQLSSMRALVNDLGESVHQLDRVAEGIQKSVMDTRMVPIGPLFSRFKRVVRDYVKESDKDIKLVIRGDKTELDKRMIDELGDPLIHMIRNSADHGIESPSEREKHGKPRQGTITLDAFHRGNQVFVEVRDDGGGIDAEKVKQKAVSKGIITSDEAERMGDRQAFTLIWQPGFSTAEQVTEISGRGMGMDIVLSKLEKLNGTVEIDSELHQGTKITIKLPLTIAILPSLLTVISRSVFAIPVESVLEIVQVDDGQFSTVHGAQTAVIRGRVVSVIELHDVLKCNSLKRDDEPDKCKKTLVIVGNKGNELGLIVDDLLGEEDIVIKSLAENYENVKGFAGASILGDGRVSLILDVSEIIEMSNRQGTGFRRNRTKETLSTA